MGPEPWHALPLETVGLRLRSGPAGLSQAEAERRLEEVGINRLPRPDPPARWQVLARQFRSPLIAVLALAAVVSLAIGDRKDAAFIVGVLLLNALIGGVQEWRAERSSQALQQLLRIRATVIRDGEGRQVDAEELAPGDRIRLESGDRVPADCRLQTTDNLVVDESLLTGESLTVLKQADWHGEPSTPLADRLNMVHGGSVVVRGRAQAVVVATGARTAVGRLALDMLATSGGKPPLISRMERFTRVITLAVLVAALLVMVLGIVGQGYRPVEMVMFAVALAVSAIPEGLPVALTVALAVGTHRMARRGVIVRRLPAVEGLGSCTLIATDKTGTLTCNALTVRQLVLAEGDAFTVSGEGYTPVGEVQADPADPVEVPLDSSPRRLDRLARAACLCNEADLLERDHHWSWRGDPTDIALLVLARKLGWDRGTALKRHPLLRAIPFEPEQQFSASIHPPPDDDPEALLLVKGAPERVLAMCRDGAIKSRGAPMAQRMAARGLRVLALAEGRIPLSDSDNTTGASPVPHDLSLLGLVGMIDPLRPGTREAIASCHDAGIAVWMVTGDHPATALAIGRELALARSDDDVVTGAQLERLWPSSDRGPCPEAAQRLIRTARVFARIAPHQKLQLVEAARASGDFVAVTGDGVNDAPALQAANIGVAMGRSGTDVAREAAELVISDDNFASIVAGVEEGRIAYANVRKVIYLLVSTGAAEIVLIALAMGSGLPLPLLPAQLLWLNLVTNGIQDVALAFEPGEGDVLSRRPRSPREPIFNGLMLQRCLLAALVMGGVGFSTFSWLLAHGRDVEAARNILLLLMVLFENIHIGNCRSERLSVFRLSPLRSPVLLLGTATAFLLHLLMMLWPAGQALLSTAPVDGRTWMVLIGLALTILVAMELQKLAMGQGLPRKPRQPVI